MFLRLFVFSTIPFVPTIVSASTGDADLGWFSADPSGSEWQLDQGAVSSNLVFSPSDQTTSMFEPAKTDGDTDAFFENTNPSLFAFTDNNILSSANAEPISDIFDDIADCSMSSPVGKSRIRRRGNAQSCPDPTRGTGVAPLQNSQGPLDLSDIKDKLKPETLKAMETAGENEDHNSLCFLITYGVLPFGVCSSPMPGTTNLDGSFWQSHILGRFAYHTLLYGTLGSYFFPRSLAPPVFFKETLFPNCATVEFLFAKLFFLSETP